MRREASRRGRPDVALRHPGVTGEVGDGVRDLRARRRDELAEQVGCDSLLLGRQYSHRALEVVGHDLRSAAEPLERGGAQDLRALIPLDVPEPLHHELQVRSLDGLVACIVRDPPAPAEPGTDPPRGNLVEHGLRQLRLDSDLSPPRACQRSSGRSIAARPDDREIRSSRR